MTLPRRALCHFRQGCLGSHDGAQTHMGRNWVCVGHSSDGSVGMPMCDIAKVIVQRIGLAEYEDMIKRKAWAKKGIETRSKKADSKRQHILGMLTAGHGTWSTRPRNLTGESAGEEAKSEKIAKITHADEKSKSLVEREAVLRHGKVPRVVSQDRRTKQSQKVQRSHNKLPTATTEEAELTNQLERAAKPPEDAEPADQPPALPSLQLKKRGRSIQELRPLLQKKPRG